MPFPRRSCAWIVGLAILGACGDAENTAVSPGDPARVDAGPSRDAGGGGDALASEDATTGGDAPVAGSVKSGVLIGGPGSLPGAIAGIDFRSGKEKGTTDAAGSFRYEDGANITFSIAGVELASVRAKPKLSPFALAGGPCSVSEALRRVLVTLETLDDDGQTSTGIHVPPIAPPANESRKLAAMSNADFATWIGALGGAAGHAVADPDAALTRFVLRVDDEEWTKTNETPFDTATSAARSQGVAWNGTSYLFSWTLGLQRTDANLATQVNKPAAIPLDMLIGGSNHIGDIDVHAGTLYAPIEDGNKYQKPTIVLFDAQTLDPKGPRFSLSNTLLTKGVPWIAIDGPRSVAYVAEWDPTPTIFVYDLATFMHQKSITLSRILGRIQGAKVLDGALYVASDDDAKTVLKVDLDTGIVLPPLFTYGATVVKELEGIVAIPANGSKAATLRVLGVDAGGSSVTFRTHTRSRAPIRSEVCVP